MVGNNKGTGVDPKNIEGVVGGPSNHVPVMLNEVLSTLQPANGQTIIDGTFGAGGYSRAILEAGSDLIAIDRDPSARAAAEQFQSEYGKRFRFCEGEFGQIDQICAQRELDRVDGIVLDIGVSSMQIDQPERGFSFQKDGPLDMRMGQAGLSAADVINQADGKDLTRIIGLLGEEKHASRVSRAIVSRREDKPFLRTLDLADLIEKTLGRKFNDKIHPATRTFQALRIFVNGELDQLANGLIAAEKLLKAGGRLVIVTFHSLEDRIVKRFFADRTSEGGGSRHLPEVERVEPSFVQNRSRPLTASEQEVEANPRARSAKLRWGVRTEAAAHGADMSIFGKEVGLQLSGRF